MWPLSPLHELRFAWNKVFITLKYKLISMQPSESDKTKKIKEDLLKKTQEMKQKMLEMRAKKR